MTHHLPTIAILVVVTPFSVGSIYQSIRNALPGIVQLRSQIDAL